MPKPQALSSRGWSKEMRNQVNFNPVHKDSLTEGKHRAFGNMEKGHLKVRLGVG